MQENNTEYDSQTEKVSMTDADSVNDENVSPIKSDKSVILERSVCKCSTTSLKPDKNSSIKASQKAIRENIPAPPLPLPSNDYVYSYGDLNRLSKNDALYKKYLERPITVKEGLLEIIRKYDPNYFLTFQLPSKRRTYDYLKFEPKLKGTMNTFEWKLGGRHWFKHPIHFICFMEKGISGYWHAHILFKSDKDINTVKKALNEIKTIQYKNHKKIIKRFPIHSFDIQAITKHSSKVNPVYNSGVELYCIKELRPDCWGNFDSDRMIFSEDLFTFDKKNEKT